MNLIELRDRLTNIIEENNTRFPTENRNQFPVFVNYHITQRVHHYAPIKYAESSLYGFVEGKHGFVLDIDDTAILEYGRNQKKVH